MSAVTIDQSWTRAGLYGSGSGRARAVIFKLFRAFFRLILSMSTQNIFLRFFLIFCVMDYYFVYNNGIMVTKLKSNAFW